ncbi:helix-turn-helix domain-containing protein [Micromonospora sp. NPDC048930]|uniref:nSTAND1 domain-containing NTPase n=1 Tax=Micromonospora sp. NPDC048930 TaxID=3364261 RepID=UPI00371A1A12
MPDVPVGELSSDIDGISTRAEFARELTLLRERAGLTVRQVAAKVHGVGGRSTVGDWFAGRGLPSISSQEPLKQLLSACGVDDPSVVERWLQAWRRVRRPPGRRPGGAEPYRGLSAFRVDDADWFFGRQGLTEQLVARLGDLTATDGGVLVVVGASGSGKSSLLQAGMIAALRNDALEGSASWPVLLFTPGPQPVKALAAQLDGLHWDNTTTGAGRLVVVVDHFEETFTSCADPDERQRFITELTELAAQPTGALVVLGLRADFYAHALRYPELLAALQEGQLTVGPMTEAELREAIIEPARKAKLEVEEGLVELLLRDLSPRGDDRTGGQAAGMLPLLSHALYATWEHGQRHQLTITSYREVGGISRAVAATADTISARLSADQQALARRLFLRLVHVSPDMADARRRVRLAELLTDGERQAAQMEDLLDQFIAARLITADIDTVEISHEALLTAWPTLRSWLNTNRAGLVIGQELDTAAAAWRRDNRDPAALYRGARLAAAEQWAADHRTELNAVGREFLETSARHERRRGRRAVQVIAALTALTLATCVFAGYAFHQRALADTQRHEAVEQRNQAISRLVAGRADRLRSRDVSLAAQLSLAGYRIAPTAEARSSLLNSYLQPTVARLHGFPTAAQAVAFSPDGHLLAAAGLDHIIRLWDTHNTEQPRELASPPLTGPTQALYTLAFSPDGTTLAAAGADRAVYLWNVTDPNRPQPVGAPLTGPSSTIYSLAFRPDGRVLAAGSDDKTIRRWDLSAPGAPHPLPPLTGPTAAVQAVAYSPDGHLLAAGSADASVRLWNTTNQNRPTAVGPPLTGHTTKVLTVAFSPDGKTLASGSADQTVRRWDLTNPARPTPRGPALTGPTSWINALQYSPDGRTLAAGTSDNTVTTWDSATGRLTSTLPHPTPVTGIAFAPDRRTLASSSNDGQIRLWTVPAPQLTGATDALFSMSFSPDGRTLAGASRDASVRLWDLTDPRHGRLLSTITSPPGKPPFAATAAFSPDGRTLAIGTRTGTVQLWDTTDPALPNPLPAILTGPTALVETLAFSPDGHTLAAGGDDTNIHLWDLTQPAAPTHLATITNTGGLVFAATFSPDGTTLAAALSDNTARLWNLTDPARPTTLGPPLSGFSGYVYGIAFHPEGKILAVGSADKTTRLWDLTAPGRPVPLGPPLTGPTGSVYWVTFSPDGQTLAAASLDGAITAWNTHDPRRPQITATLTNSTNPLYTTLFSPDGHTLAGASADSTIRLWDPDPERVAAWICASSGESISRDEWSQHIPDIAYHPPC